MREQVGVLDKQPAMKARDLDVYKRAFSASMEIHRLSDAWPKHELYGGLADQIRRASRGICANIVEGLGKVGPLEQRRFLNMALGSAEEVTVWLDFAMALGYMPNVTGTRLSGEYVEISRMLYGLMRRRR